MENGAQNFCWSSGDRMVSVCSGCRVEVDTAKQQCPESPLCLVCCRVWHVLPPRLLCRLLGGGWTGMSTCRNLQQVNPRRVIAGAQGSWSSSDSPLFTASISWSLWPSASPFSSISLGLYLCPVWIPSKAGRTKRSPLFPPSLLPPVPMSAPPAPAPPPPRSGSGSPEMLLCFFLSDHCCSALDPSYWTTRTVHTASHLIFVTIQSNKLVSQFYR